MVEIYSSDYCIWSRKMKSYLNSKGVDYRSIDAADPENAKRAFELTGQRGIPVTVIGDTSIVGYNTQAVDNALQKL